MAILDHYYLLTVMTRLTVLTESTQLTCTLNRFYDHAAAILQQELLSQLISYCIYQQKLFISFIKIFLYVS